MAMEAHDETVRLITARVKQFAARKQPFRIYHGSTNSTRGSQRRPDNTVDTSALNRVLKVDKSRKTAMVEPNVPMDGLVAATVAHGLVPLVVMEFPGITAGGGFSGTSGESSSFRHGPFDATVNWIEIVLASGAVVRASRTTDENTDLFWGAASAFGTLGVVTLLEVQLQDAQPYMRLTYTLQDTVQGARRQLEEEIGRSSRLTGADCQPHRLTRWQNESTSTTLMQSCSPKRPLWSARASLPQTSPPVAPSRGSRAPAIPGSTYTSAACSSGWFRHTTP